MRALVVERDVPRFAAARVVGALLPGGGAAVGPLRLVERDPLELPGPAWVRIRPIRTGICGSDLATVDGRSSRWFEPIVSFPFTPGHEVLADHEGSRVVLEPVLGCAARGIAPTCAACAAGHLGHCGNLAHGDLAPGLQSGFCCDTGGGWASEMLAHPSQLHEVPAALDDDAAVLIEPTACALHAALAGAVQPDESVLVLGAGTLGLLVTAALRQHRAPRTLAVVAKHPVQRDLARALGATDLLDAGEVRRGARRLVGGPSLGTASQLRLGTGVDVVFDCVGSAESVADALAVTRPGGRIVLVGMPEPTRLDLTPLWHREISLVGAYAYGVEPSLAGAPRTFAAAMDLVADADLGRLLSVTYPLDRHVAALAHAASAGARGAVKVAFDLTKERTR
jgi:threonine dehydrogenase-like Zn-dependent dehydrogenase